MIRKARIDDVKSIQTLINGYAQQNIMLGRSLGYLYEHIRDFFVVINDKTGTLEGCCALHISWEYLGEVKSLAVAQDCQKKGLGKQLVQTVLAEAKQLGLHEVFALTYVPGFFEKMGFVRIEKTKLPHKIWFECVDCVKFPHCDEIPVLLKL